MRASAFLCRCFSILALSSALLEFSRVLCQEEENNVVVRGADGGSSRVSASGGSAPVLAALRRHAELPEERGAPRF